MRQTTFKIVHLNKKKSMYRDYQIYFSQINRKYFVSVNGVRHYRDTMDEITQFVDDLYV